MLNIENDKYHISKQFNYIVIDITENLTHINLWKYKNTDYYNVKKESIKINKGKIPIKENKYNEKNNCREVSEIITLYIEEMKKHMGI